MRSYGENFRQSLLRLIDGLDEKEPRQHLTMYVPLTLATQENLDYVRRHVVQDRPRWKTELLVAQPRVYRPSEDTGRMDLYVELLCLFEVA